MDVRYTKVALTRLEGLKMASSTLTSVTRAFFKQMVNTHRIPLTFAPEEPNAESLEAIREGDAFLASGKKGRFNNGADLIAAAMAQ